MAMTNKEFKKKYPSFEEGKPLDNSEWQKGVERGRKILEERAKGKMLDDIKTKPIDFNLTEEEKENIRFLRSKGIDHWAFDEMLID